MYCIQRFSEISGWEGRFPIAEAAYGSSYARVVDLTGSNLAQIVIDSVWPPDSRRNSVMLQVSSWSLRHEIPLPENLRRLYESDEELRHENAKRFAVFTFDEGVGVSEALSCGFERKMRMTLHFPDTSTSLSLLFGECLELWCRQDHVFRRTLSALVPEHGTLVGGA